MLIYFETDKKMRSEYRPTQPDMSHPLVCILEPAGSNFEYCLSSRTNLPKQVMEYPDFPFPVNCKTFPTHGEVLDYLQAYSSSFGLEEFIQFEHKVTNVKLLQNNVVSGSNVKWQVTTNNLQTNASSASTFDSVIVCNG